MNLSDATAIYIGDQAASAVYITDAAGTPTKVWPTAPTYPITGEWGPIASIPAEGLEVFTHTITEAGTYTCTATVVPTGIFASILIDLNGGQDSSPTGQTSVTWTRAFAAGDVLTWMVGAYQSGGSGTYSITKTG